MNINTFKTFLLLDNWLIDEETEYHINWVKSGKKLHWGKQQSFSTGQLVAFSKHTRFATQRNIAFTSFQECIDELEKKNPPTKRKK